MEPNRETGNWLPEVESCPNRAKPCGNPLDADEAMRAGETIATNGNSLSKLTAEQAMKHAKNIADDCSVPKGKCPLEKHFGCDRKTALEKVSQMVSSK